MLSGPEIFIFFFVSEHLNEVKVSYGMSLGIFKHVTLDA